MKNFRVTFILIFSLYLISSALHSVGQTCAWVNHFGGVAAEHAFSVIVDETGHIYSTGHGSGVGDYDPGSGEMNLTNPLFFYVSKLDSSGNFCWAKSIGSSLYGNDPHQIIEDHQGNLYVVGEFYGTLDFDPGVGVQNLVAQGTRDFFILKLDTAGNLKWAKKIGGSGGDIAYGIDIDHAGYIYTIGGYYTTVNFDPNGGTSQFTSQGYDDIFITKMDSLGNLLWVKSIGGIGSDSGYKIELDSSANIYCTGKFSDTVDFDPGPGIFNISTTSIWGSAFVLKLDSSGSFQWAKAFVGSGSTSSTSLTLDNEKNTYIGGSFTGNVDFDPDLGVMNLSTPYGNYFLTKLDSLGHFVWNVSDIDTVNTSINSVRLDNYGNLFATGSYSKTTDINPGSGVFYLTGQNQNSTHMFLMKLDTAGNFKWAMKGNSSFQIAQGIDLALDTANHIYLVGDFTGVTSFSIGPIVSQINSFGDYDTYLMKLNDCEGAPPIANPIIGPDSVCVGTTHIFSTQVLTDALFYEWTLPSGWTGTSTTNLISATCNNQDGIIRVKAVNYCGTSIEQSLAVHVDTLPAPVILSVYGITDVCMGTTQTYHATSFALPGGLIWTLPSGWSGMSNDTIITVTVGSSNGNVTVSSNTGTCTTSHSLPVTVNTSIPATPSSITGNQTICHGSIQTYSCAQTFFASSYSWTLPSGWTGTSSTNTITSTASNSGGYVYAYSINSCGSSLPDSIYISVLNTPSPTIITGNTTVCQGSSNTYLIGAVAGANHYNWTLPSGWTGISTTTQMNSVAGINSGTIYAFTVDNCGVSVPQNLFVSVHLLPPDPIISEISFGLLESSSANGNQWYLNSSLIPSATSQDYSYSQNGSYSVEVTINGCSSFSQEYLVDFLGTNEKMVADDGILWLAPNPVRDKLFIHSSNKINNVQLTDLTGRLVFFRQGTESSFFLNIPELDEGIYFVRLETDSGTVIRRFIKTN